MIRYSSAGRAVKSDLRFNYSHLTITVSISFPCMQLLIKIFSMLGNFVFQRIFFYYFHVVKHSLNRNEIRAKGAVALGEALKVNMTLQSLR